MSEPNVETANTVLLGTSGAATIEHAPSGAYVLAIGYNGVELTREVKPSFKWLSNQINNSEGSEISLEQDYIYDSSKDYVLTNGIEFAKDMTIDGQGHLIDAKGSSNIFYFDDNNNSYSLTLKNIVFANAAGVNGAAVYFKGNKLEIINCTFKNNKASSEGDAVYVENALSNANKIVESEFIGNTGGNSVLYLNLDSNANLTLTDSIFASNAAIYNVNGTENVILEHNWMGSTDENNNDLSKVKNVTVKNWLFLKIDAVAAMNGDATISLNNVNENGNVSTYSEYALHPITFTLGGLNATVSVPEITLDNNGQANYQFRMDRAFATLTASYDNVTASKKLQYSVDDDGSFRALNEIIFFSEEGEVIELTHDYTYFDNDTIEEGIVIPRKITINGNGHTIDAKYKTRIFWVPENGASHITISNVSFIKAKVDHGSVIVINVNSTYFTFLNCNFTNNAATSYGGVIDCVGDYCTIKNCNFINNSAVSNAGAIRYYHSEQAYIENCNFINNRVSDGSKGGGAIYVDEGNVNIDKSTFINNVANDKPGSVLYNEKAGFTTTITNSLFMNNHGVDVIHSNSIVKLADNWFGNNATDYNNLSNTVNRASGTWLFLNASVDSKSIPESWPADLSFRLYVYNSTSGNISEYGGDFFDSLELTITATNGRSDKSIVSLGEVFSYTPSVPGNGSVTTAVENVFCTAKFDVHEREDSHLSMDSPNITYRANAIVSLSYNASATGKVNITLKGNNGNYSFIDVDLNASFVVDEILNSGEYSVTAVYSGDAVFKNTTANSTLTVDKVNSTLEVDNHVVSVDYGGSVDVKVTFGGATGITAKIEDSDVDVSGNVITVSGLSAGTHVLTVTTIPDDNHNSVTKTVDVTVRKVDSTLTVGNITFDYDSNGSASVSFTGANGIVARVLNQSNAVVNVKGNVITVSGLNVGNYTLSVTAVADDNHNNVTKFAKITINKVDSSLLVGDVELDYGGSVDVNVTFEGATGITAKIDNDDVNVSGNVITVSGLSAGTHILTVTTNC